MNKIYGLIFGILSGFAVVWSFAYSQREPVISPLSTEELSNYIDSHGANDKNSHGDFALLLQNPANSGQVAGINTDRQTSNTSTSNTPKSLTIGFLGDSMIDTLGKDLSQVEKELGKHWPTIEFNLLNYGAGATNIEMGLERLVQETTYLDQKRPPLLSQSPDIIVIESFAYNHWNNDQSGLDRQWTNLIRIVDSVKRHNPNIKIVLSATIAPYCPTYTDGSANLPKERKWIECQTVIAYLKNMENFANSTRLPFANAFSASLKNSEGNPIYINQSDHIHPSDLGKELFAREFVKSINLIIADLTAPGPNTGL